MSRWRDLNYLMGLQLVYSCLKRGTLSERDLSVTNGNLRALHPLLVNFIIIRIEYQSLQTPCMVNRRQMCKIVIPPNSSHCSYRASPPPSLILIWHIVNLYARAPSFLCFNLSAAKDKTMWYLWAPVQIFFHFSKGRQVPSFGGFVICSQILPSKELFYLKKWLLFYPS